MIKIKKERQIYSDMRIGKFDFEEVVLELRFKDEQE